MIYYSNGCYRSEIKVTPANWATARASVKKKWRVYYRYYDPAYKNDPVKWGQMFQIKGMNDLADLKEKQSITKFLINQEKEKLDNQGYNPVAGTYYSPPESSDIKEITPDIPFIKALWAASELLTCVMMGDIKCVIRGMEEAAGKLFDKKLQKSYKALKVSQITRRHIVYMLEQRKKDNKTFGSYRQNKYRTALMMLYKKLVALEAVESNPIRDIPINHDYAHKERELLTEAEQIIIDTNLKTWDYHFWRYMRIFHRSGSRSSEMAQLKRDGGKNDGSVKLEKQEFKVLIRKGKKWAWAIRPIPDDVLHLWIEAYEETKPGEYLFGCGLKPSHEKMGKKAPADKWKKYVKNQPGKFDPFGKGWGLGINKDFYGLKALNMDSIDEKAGELESGAQLAADAAGHGDTKMAKKHYLPGHEKRQREKLKKISVPFAVKKEQDN